MPNNSDIESDGQEDIIVIYYLLGKRPVKVTYVDEFPELVQTPDFETKEFVFDHSVMKRIDESLDVKKIDENEFRDACLAIGVKPI